MRRAYGRPGPQGRRRNPRLAPSTQSRTWQNYHYGHARPARFSPRISHGLSQQRSTQQGTSEMNDSGYSEDRATTAKLAYRLRESAGKEGVYYILRFPARWRLYSFPWEDFGDLWHGDVWRRYVINDLAEAWAGGAKVTAEQLK